MLKKYKKEEDREKLMDFIEEEKIETGLIFLSSKGNPVDRSNLRKQL